MLQKRIISQLEKLDERYLFSLTEESTRKEWQYQESNMLTLVHLTLACYKHLLHSNVCRVRDEKDCSGAHTA